MPFEPYEGGRPRRRRPPAATIQPESGRVTLSDAAAKDLQEAARLSTAAVPPTLEAVKLFFDRDRHIIGMQAVPQGTPLSSRVRSQRTGTTVVFAAKGFLDHFGINIGNSSRRFPTFIEKGLLCIDLTQESEVITGSRARQPAKGIATNTDDGDSGASSHDTDALSNHQAARTQEPATVR